MIKRRDAVVPMASHEQQVIPGLSRIRLLAGPSPFLREASGNSKILEPAILIPGSFASPSGDLPLSHLDSL